MTWLRPKHVRAAVISLRCDQKSKVIAAIELSASIAARRSHWTERCLYNVGRDHKPAQESLR